MTKAELRERALDILNLYVAHGWSLQRIGDKYGITRQRVLQILNSYWKHRPVAELKDFVESSAERQADAKTAKECVCCLRPHHRKTRTCSHRCSELWTLTRYRRDDGYRDNHRLYKARSVMKKPERYTPEQVRHSEAVLNGTARRYDPPRYSRASQVEIAMLTIQGLRGVID